MPFLKRLGFYLVGLSIGIVFLTFFLKKKSDETGAEFCYLPNCRVLKELRAKPIAFANGVRQSMIEHNIDTVLIKNVLTGGKVDFKRSDTQAVPCKHYWVSHDHVTVSVKNCDGLVTVEALEVVKK